MISSFTRWMVCERYFENSFRPRIYSQISVSELCYGYQFGLSRPPFFTRCGVWVDILCSRRSFVTHHWFKCIFASGYIYGVKSKVYIRNRGLDCPVMYLRGGSRPLPWVWWLVVCQWTPHGVSKHPGHSFVNTILYDVCSLIQRVKDLLLVFTNGFPKFFEKFWVVFLQNIDVRF